MERSNGAVKTAFDIQVNGKRGPGRPKMTWKQLTERDRREWKLSAIDPHDRDTWRSGVRSACLQQASCLEGGPLLWIWSLYLHVNQKSDDDDDDDDDITTMKDSYIKTKYLKFENFHATNSEGVIQPKFSCICVILKQFTSVITLLL